MFYHIAWFIFWIINLFICRYIINSLWNWLTIIIQYHHPHDRWMVIKYVVVFWRLHVIISPSLHCISPQADCSSYFSCPKGTAVKPPGSLCAHLWSSPAKTWDEKQKQEVTWLIIIIIRNIILLIYLFWLYIIIEKG